MELSSAPSNAIAEMLAYSLGHKELRVFRPAVELLHQPDFFFSQWFAMRRIRILLVRRSIPNVAIDNDERRPIRCLLEGLKCPPQHFQIVGVAHPGDVPSVADKPRRNVLAE